MPVYICGVAKDSHTCVCMCVYISQFALTQYFAPRAKKHSQHNTKHEKQKMCSELFHITFFTFRVIFRIFQYFAPGLAFSRNVRGFHGLFFRSINETQN